MAAPAFKAIGASASTSRASPAIRLAKEEDLASPSPALAAQEELLGLWEASGRSAAEDEAWSPRRKTAFIVATCGGFWTVVGLLILHAFS
jgi:hypothetical protein